MSLLWLLLMMAPLSLQQSVVDVRCTAKFCGDATALKPCPELPEDCRNSSNSFRKFPSPDPCNCCETCLLYLQEGEECPLGDYGQPPPDTICGPGLRCLKEDGAALATCQKMNTTCALAQAAYDALVQQGEAPLASWRPSCDDRGLFSPAQCVPNSLCFCVEPYSAVRVFGEAVFRSAQAQKELQCECGRAAWRASQLLGAEVATARCTEDGGYEPLQCVAGKCVCVDQDTGELDPGGDVVDVNDLLDGSLPCFDASRHQERRYELPCEKERREALTTRAEMEALGVVALGLEQPSCAPDGRYAKLQVRRGQRLCVDPEGALLEDFSTPLSRVWPQPLDCNCARTRWLLRREGRGGDLPRCCSCGNFLAWQCWRGTCFCVDPQGSPTSWDVPEEDRASLPCYAPAPELPCASSTRYERPTPPPTTDPTTITTTDPTTITTTDPTTITTTDSTTITITGGGEA